jgi:protein-S-isoprenylcysteine O-methyltransferase Ste14
MFRDQTRDLAARALVASLFALLSINLLNDFMRTGHITGLLLLVSEALIVILTVVRRRARIVDRSTAAAVATTLSIVGPPLLRAGSEPGLLPDMVTAIVSALGLLLVIGGKMTLGRSFGIAPANRGVVARGPYLLCRHPIYAGYLITHVAFLVAQPTALNLIIVAVADTALIARALIEERVLSMDAEYQTYCQRVAWHLVPGVF